MKKRKKWTKLKGEKGGLTARCGRGRAVVERRRGVVGRRGGRGRAARWSRCGRAARCSRSGGAAVEGGARSGGATTAGAGRGGGRGRRDDGGATENLGSTSPAISLLRAKCRSARRRRGGYIAEGHRCSVEHLAHGHRRAYLGAPNPFVG